MAMTSRDGVQMDVPAVKGVGDTFGKIGDTLTAVSNTLNTLITILDTTAFVGLVGGWALRSYLAQLQPQIKKMAQDCLEMKKDLYASAEAYQNGDRGAARFF